MADIEMTIFDSTLPVNTLATMHRIQQLLEEGKTNSLMSLKGDLRSKAQACVLILWEQAMMGWDVLKEWERIREELKPERIAEKLVTK